eukprot:4076697-Pleurochrysis_carterae.AAC.3
MLYGVHITSSIEERYYHTILVMEVNNDHSYSQLTVDLVKLQGRLRPGTTRGPAPPTTTADSASDSQDANDP